jgi:uncharacterized membrane protein
MPSKYDTNPLDPEFPEKAKAAAAAADATQVLEQSGARTRQFPPTAGVEEQTRRFTGGQTGPYEQPFTGQYVPAGFPQGVCVTAPDERKRKIEKIGIPENVAVAAPYFPFTIGLVAGVLELLFVPRHETKVRFHAAQGLAAHFGVIIVTTVLGIISEFTDLANIGSGIFNAVATVMLIVFTVKAWKGKPIHIPSLDALTNWLEEKIFIKPKD